MATRLDLANAQLLGYYNGKCGTLIGMIEAMALTKKEWVKLKKDYEPYIDETDKNEIDNFLREAKKKCSNEEKGNGVLSDVSTHFTVGYYYSVVYMWRGIKIRTQGKLTSKTNTRIRITDDKNTSHSIKLCDVLN